MLLLDFYNLEKYSMRLRFTNNDLSHVKQKNTFQINLTTKKTENGFQV